MCIINFFISHLIFILLSSLFLFAFLNIIVFLPNKNKTNIVWTIIGYLYYLTRKALLFSIIIFFVYFILGILNLDSFIPLESLSKLELDKSMELIFSACITSIGVFAGFYFNKKQTYKEIVTRERIEWLHKMQKNLAEYLEPSPQTDSGNLDKDNKTANRLYYELIFNINHTKDKDALNALNNYHNLIHDQPDKLKVNLALKDDLNIGLVLDKGEEDEILFLIKNKSERDKLKDLILPDKLEKIKISNGNESFYEEEVEKELALLKKKVAKEFTKIFNETWRDIKREAD